MQVKLVTIVVALAFLGLPLRASCDETQKPSAAPSAELLAALRDAKTASFVEEEFRRDDKLESKDSIWHNTIRTYLKDNLDRAKIKLVDSDGDVSFIVRSSVKTASATYVPQGSVGNSQAIKMASGASIQGTLKILRKGSVIGTIPFQGNQNTPSSLSLGRGSNPTIAALGNSDLVPDFLQILVAARGPSMLQPIIEDNRMILSVSTDWSGRMRAYESVFEVLASSREEWAEKMLSELAKDKESPTANRLAEKALQKRNQAKHPSKQ